MPALHQSLVGRIGQILHPENRVVLVRVWVLLGVTGLSLLMLLFLWPQTVRLLYVSNATDRSASLDSPSRVIRFRIAPKHSIWTMEQDPIFVVAVRNLGDQKVHLCRLQDGWELEIDGIWYHHSRRLETSTSALFGGSEWSGLAVVLDRSIWLAPDVDNRRLEKIPLKPGKHTLRLRTKAALSDASNQHQRPFKLISNSVEFEMVETNVPGSEAYDKSHQSANLLSPAMMTPRASSYSDSYTNEQPGLIPIRLLAFPSKQSLGNLYIQEGAGKASTNYFLDIAGSSGWNYLGAAKGVVAVPTNQRIRLDLQLNQECRDLSTLTRFEPNALHTFTINGKEIRSTEADEVMLAQLRGLAGLNVLALNNVKVTRRAFIYLKGLRTLQHLSICQFPYPPEQNAGRLNDSCLKPLTELTSLTTLRLKGSQITDDGLAEIAKLSHLSELDLESDKIEGHGLVHLRQLPELRYFSLRGPVLQENSLANLAAMRSLAKLHLGNLILTNIAVPGQCDLPHLVELDLYNAYISGQGLSFFKSLRSLKRLVISWAKDSSGFQWGAEEAANLLGLQSLESLALNNLTLTDAALAKLTALPRLKSLRLLSSFETDPGTNLSQYSNASLEVLSQRGDWEELKIGGLALTDQGMTNLDKLKGLRSLDLSAPQISNAGLAPVASLTSLETLALQTPGVTLSGLNQLNSLTNLQQLYLALIENDQGGLNLSHLTKLKDLNISQREVDDETPENSNRWRDADMAWISSLTNLHRLWGIRGISDHGMQHLSNLHALEWLDIGGLAVTDASMIHLVHMPQLKHLALKGRITDKGLRCLEGLKSLRFLSIGPEAIVSPEAIQRLRQALPELEVLYGPRRMGAAG